jgi:hypothetical protein
MYEIYGRKYFLRDWIEDDYKYVFLDHDELIKPDEVNIELTNSIIKIRQEKALQILYASLDIKEKRELMELILNDTDLL